MCEKNVESPIIDGSLSDQSASQHGNPLKPDRTRDDVGKNLDYSIVAGFQRMYPVRRGQFPGIPSISANPQM